jgi:nucleoside-diphosphate-sugar epimerase
MGQSVVDAAREAGVSHLIYISAMYTGSAH